MKKPSKRQWLAAMLVGAGLMVNTALPASGAESENYMVIKAGIFTPEGYTEDFDDGPVIEIGFGHYFNPNAALEATFDIISLNYPAYPVEYDLDVGALTVNIKGILPIDNAEVYGMAGLGMYYISSWIGRDVTDTVVGGDIGLGLKLKFSETFGMGFEYKYWITDTVADMEEEFKGQSLTVAFMF